MTVKEQIAYILQPIFGNEVYPMQHPDPDGLATSVAESYCIFSTVGGSTFNNLEGDTNMSRLRVQISIYTVEHDAMESYKKQVNDAMKQANINYSNAVIDNYDLYSLGVLANVSTSVPIDVFEEDSKRFCTHMDFYAWENQDMLSGGGSYLPSARNDSVIIGDGLAGLKNLIFRGLTDGTFSWDSATGTWSISPGIVTAAGFSGPLTGDVTGDVTGNASTVTTNANLTGPITSVGNETSIASQTGTGTKFVVDTAPTLQTSLTVKGTTASNLPTYSAEFLLDTGWTSTNWVGSFAAGWTHTPGNTTTLLQSKAAVSSTKYQIAYTVTGRTAGTFTIAFGGQTNSGISANGAWGPTTSSTASLVITPTSLFDGTVVISIKSITAVSSPICILQSSEGTARVELRANSSLGNTFMGLSAGGCNTTGVYNTAIGAESLYLNTTGIQNIAVGRKALYANTLGGDCIAVGMNALLANTTGYGNIAVGNGASGNNISGSYNTVIGYTAFYSNTTGNYNLAMGYTTLYNITGSNNTGIGYAAGKFQADGTTALTSVSNSVYIGALCRGYNNSDSNSVVIGCTAIGEGANTTVIGNSSTLNTHLFGNLAGKGVAAATAALHLPAATATANTSSLKLDPGVVATIPVSGNIESDGTHLYWTNSSGTRIQLDNA
jgi:hypothetical protein